MHFRSKQCNIFLARGVGVHRLIDSFFGTGKGCGTQNGKGKGMWYGT